MAQQTAETIESLEKLKMIVNKLSYITNNLGIDDSFDKALARNTLDEAMIAFNTYTQTLTK